MNIKTKQLALFAICCLVSLMALTVAAESLKTVNLTCESLKNPIGVDVKQPRLSWKLESDKRGEKQTAYHLLVASSRVKLDKDLGDLWDTGRVKTDQSIHVVYNGKPLKSDVRCYWKIRVSGEDGKESSWSKQSEWTMGLLNPEDWTAKWIAPAPEIKQRRVHPWYRCTFVVKDDITRALLHINTANLFELHINGTKVGPHVLEPGITGAYKRYLIKSYDVSPYLKKGENCIAIWMGPGWGNGRTSLRAQLDMDTSSGRVVVGTDADWSVRESCITQIGGWNWNNYGGECYDAQKFVPDWNQVAFDDSLWSKAIEINMPKHIVHSWLPCESARPGSPLKPKKIFQIESGEWVIDFGKNLNGWLRLRMNNLKPGQRIDIEYADLDDNVNIRKGLGKLSYKKKYPHNFQTHKQRDAYLGSGVGAETFCSKFNYHGFRYALISGLTNKPEPEEVEALFVEPEFDSAGKFECSNELFNQIHEVTRRTYRTQCTAINLGTGEPREKQAYGDGGAFLSGHCYNFSVAANYRKWLLDWSDNQDDYAPEKKGFFGHTAPHQNHAGGPAWGGQVSALVRRLFLFYGDREIVETMYDRLRAYVD